MFSRSELLNAIDELEHSPATYQNAEKLAVFYLLQDHLNADELPVRYSESIKEVTIDRYEGSEFYEAISEHSAAQVWAVLNELMATLQLLQPKLYRATIDKIRGI